MYAGKQFNERIKQIGFVLIIVLLFCLIVGGLQYFASSILGAFTMYIILRKPHQLLLKKGWKSTLSTSLLLFLTFIFLFVLVGSLIFLTYGKLKHFHPQQVIESLQHIQTVVLEKWSYNIFSEDLIKKALVGMGNLISGIFAATGNVVANVLMMLFVLFFMLQKSTRFEKGLDAVLPMSQESKTLLKKETNNMVLSNAIGIPLIMIGQGFTAGLAYWFLGAGDPVVWGVFTGVFGLIPVIGTAGVWVPLAINLFVGHNIWQGVFLIIYGAIVISSVDNVVRMVLLKKTANVHPLITLFGIILGMNIFGFWGIIFGPLMISLFILLIRIYNKEFVVDR